MSALWGAIAAVALASADQGGRSCSGAGSFPRASTVIALVVTQTFGQDGRLVLDERALGAGAAGVALALRAPVLIAVALSALVAALARLLG